MNKNLQQTLKTILISSLASTNILIWHNLLGAKFLLFVLVICVTVVLTSKVENA